MHLPHTLLLLVSSSMLVLQLYSSSVHAQSTGLNGWYDCAEYTFAEEGKSIGAAECAQFEAPLCHSGVCDNENQTIQVFVKRILGANADENGPNIWFLQGGPGAASTAMESGMISAISEAYGGVNVYTMDHRGTGRSNLLACVAAQAGVSGSPGGDSIDASEVPDCAQDLHRNYGDLSAFSITSAAKDLEYFITNYQKDSDVYVYGVSYGTSVVERLIHFDVPEIKGYILDGISTSSGAGKKKFEYFSMWDADYGEVADGYLKKCKDDTACAAYFSSSSLEDTLKNVMQRFDTDLTNDCASLLSNYTNTDPRETPPSNIVRAFLGSLFSDMTTRALIPALVYRFNRCNAGDVDVLSHFLKILTSSSSSTGSEGDNFTSTLLYQLIVFSEFWETPTPSQSEMIDRYTSTLISSGGMYSSVPAYCAFTQEDSAACAEVNSYTTKYPIAYEKDKYWDKAATIPSQASVLLMSSTMDPQTPHKYAQYLYDTLKGDAKALVTFHTASHGTLWTTPTTDADATATCGMMLLVSYVNASGDVSEMDTSCLKRMPPLSFTPEETVQYTYLGTYDAFDGDYDPSLAENYAPSKNPAADQNSVNNNAIATSDQSKDGDSKYKTVTFVLAGLFAVALAVAGVLIYRWRRRRRNDTRQEIEAVTPTALSPMGPTNYNYNGNSGV